MTASNIEATPSVAKIGEAWLGQKLWADRVQLRAGLLEADRYYMLSPSANVFVNSTFGFPDSWEANMPNGGPAYPNASPGAMASVAFTNEWQLTASIMNGSPIGSTAQRTSYGIGFPIGNGLLSWIETAYTPKLTFGEKTLPGNFKLGGWYNSQTVNNVTLANTNYAFSNPVNTTYHGQYSVYGLVDQAIWREANSDVQGLNLFARIAFDPQQQRNLVTAYFDTGAAYIGLFDNRPNDILGLGFAWAKFTPYLNGQITAQNMSAGTQTPIPKPESLIEVTYQAPLSPWLTVQPFFQYAINPGGKAPMPNNPNVAIPNAIIVGLRANVAF